MNWPLFTILCVVAFFAYLAIQHLLAWRMGRRLDRVTQETLQRIKDGTYESKAVPSPIQLNYDARGFTISDSQTEKEVLVHWEKIFRAEAFKRDLLAYDEICVAFELDDDSAVEIDETMSGFTKLMEAVPAYLTGFVVFSDWYLDIMTPAFETNVTPLFERPPSQDSQPQSD